MHPYASYLMDIDSLIYASDYFIRTGKISRAIRL
jgi:hypothetical protein